MTRAGALALAASVVSIGTFGTLAAGEASALRPTTAQLATPAPAAAEDEELDYLVYVAAESTDEVYKVRFDGEKATVDKVIPVGYQPTEIEGPHGMTVSPDGRHWFLSMAHGKPFGLLYKFDTETDELVGQVELGLFPATMQISRTTGLLYCVNFDLHGDMTPSSVSIVDPDAMVEVARTTTGAMPHGSRVSPDGLRHYSCSMMSGELFELDAASFEVRRTLKLDEAPEGGHGDSKRHGEDRGGGKHRSSKPTWVHPHPSEPLAYVCLNGADQVAEVDLTTWTVRRRFQTGHGPYNVEITPDGAKLVVSYKASGEVGIWDVERGVELARIRSSRRVTHGVAISPDGRYGFVSNEGIGGESGTVDVFDLRKDELVATAEVGLQAGGITFWRTETRD
ncbi:MAG: YncE family protein [Planctomycetota bacterium]